MEAKIRIEQVPKLDKILRVTFSAIKKDFNEIKEDISELQEDMVSFTEKFNKKLNKNSDLISKNTEKKLSLIDQEYSNKVLEIEKQIERLSNSINVFVKKSNEKTKELNHKYELVKNFKNISDQLNNEIKNLKLLKGDIAKISALKQDIEFVEENTFSKNEINKKIKSITKKVDKKLSNNDADYEIFTKRIESEITNDKRIMNNRLSSIVKSVDKVFEKNKKESSKIKDLYNESKKNTEIKIKQIKGDFSDLEKDLKERFEKASSELGNLVNNETIKNRSDIEEIKAENIKLTKEIESIIKNKDDMKKISKVLTKYADLKAVQKIESELNKEKDARKALELEINSIKKQISKTQNVEKTDKKKVIKKSPEKKIKNDEKPGFFKRVLNFLVEEVDDENDKDKRLQEFDRNKQGKFEIKEIKELK